MKTPSLWTIALLIGTSFNCSSNAEIINLRTAFEIEEENSEEGNSLNLIRGSRTLKLSEGQIARVLHFYSYIVAEGGPVNGDNCGLFVEFGDMVIEYTHTTLFGGVNMVNDFAFTQGNSLPGFPVIVGPASITIKPRLGQIFDNSDELAYRPGRAICSIEVEGDANVADDGGNITQTVITPDQDGPVEVLIESSTDMKQTWQPTAPGIYGESDGQRIFRLRAIER